jgi:hypothetical protein
MANFSYGPTLAFGALADAINSGFKGAAEGQEDARRQRDSDMRQQLGQQQLAAFPLQQQAAQLNIDKGKQDLATGEWQSATDPVSGRVMQFNKLDPAKQRLVYPGSARTHTADGITTITYPDGRIEQKRVPVDPHVQQGRDRDAAARMALERAATFRTSDPALYQKYLMDAYAHSPELMHKTFGNDAAEMFSGGGLTTKPEKVTSDLDREALRLTGGKLRYHELPNDLATQVRNSMRLDNYRIADFGGRQTMRQAQIKAIDDLIAGRQAGEALTVLAKEKATLYQQYGRWRRAAQDPIAAASEGKTPEQIQELMSALEARMSAVDAKSQEVMNQRPRDGKTKEPAKQADAPGKSWADIVKRGRGGVAPAGKPGG